ncbi:GNAT family N-acetyltransferase [Photobacterium sp.]|uniref:GNAT family N-acetyltransferase n=1 Tax=Photobacterium sp. TaxID=660 RepID=UPI00299DEDA1|nr:GNAT family N-acetyltransferase [Photobacterium sp.]MDX1301754.1 GNAT family N-acetyltransferase [Photobacterium sp.]
MNLIQLNPIQLDKLIKLDEKPQNFLCLEGAIPPGHVLVRSIKYCDKAMDKIWALPYFIQKSSQIIGCCGFKGEPNSNRVEIGYNVALNAQGLGGATAAVKILSQIAFDSGVINTVVALISSSNVASLNVVRKNGFLYKEMVIDEDGEQLESWELHRLFKHLESNA